MKKDKITIVTRKIGDPIKLGRTNLDQIRRMSDKEVDRRARLDPDNPPLTKAELAKFKPAYPIDEINIRQIREHLGLSQAQFARFFGVSVRTLQDWEQHRHIPGRTARILLMVIAKEPKAVQRALTSYVDKDVA